MIESIPRKVFSFEGIKNAETRSGSSQLATIYDDDGHTSYWLEYVLPESGPGWAGMSFEFLAPQNLTSYKYVEARISFGDENAVTSLFFTDAADKKDSVPLGIGVPLSGDIEVVKTGLQVTYRIPLVAHFPVVDRRIIKEIAFDCDAKNTRGTHEFTVKGIRFLR